jgi:beta-lactamase class A
VTDVDRELRGLRDDLAGAGLTGSFLVRDLDTGRQLDMEPDVVMPIASVAKVPIVLAVASRIADGSLDPGLVLDVAPGGATGYGPTGIARFRHPARIAVEDLASLALGVSDNAAADALLDLVTVDGVRDTLTRAGVADVVVRHPFRDLADTPLERLDGLEAHLAYQLAARAGSGGDGHAVWQLDTARANTGTATALADLMQELWRPSRVDAAAAARVRSLMAANAIRHRLAPDLASDDATWASKTGTLLGFRHEVGVLERHGRTVAVVAMSSSSVAAGVQPAAEAVLGHVARRMVELLER